MNREEAVQQAREQSELAAVACLTRLEMSDGDRGYWRKYLAEPIESAIKVCVRAELESLAKEMCSMCAEGRTEADGFHDSLVLKEYKLKCKAAPIRDRLALWEGEK